jgi:hypothetical protein
VPTQLADIERIAFHISLVRPSGQLSDVAVCDIGGLNNWSRFAEWYEPPVFRGHVREPDVKDLRAIAADMRLTNVRIVGRNWLGLRASNAGIRGMATLMDWPLRAFPSLCSDIYLIGQKA